MLESRCPVESCSYAARGDSEEKVLERLERHVRKEHGLNEIPQSMELQIRKEMLARR